MVFSSSGESEMTADQGKSICILIPIFNDWKTVSQLLEQIDATLSSSPALDPTLAFSVLIVNDGSTQRFDLTQFQRFRASGKIRELAVLELGRNLGNQRAIAVALSHIGRQKKWDSVIIMDGDGEDPPKYLPELIGAHLRSPERTAVFAKRIKRSESIAFRLNYQLYRLVHRVLTGRHVNVGNYSILSIQDARKLTLFAELWGHYPATFQRSKLPLGTIDIVRGKRLDGKSNMNFTSLILHGLSGISVNLDVVGIRSILASLLLIFGALVATGALAFVRLYTNITIPGWTSTLMISLFNIILISALGSLLLAFFVLGGSKQAVLLAPANTYGPFVLDEVRVF
jgi:hypothetical protein